MSEAVVCAIIALSSALMGLVAAARRTCVVVGAALLVAQLGCRSGPHRAAQGHDAAEQVLAWNLDKAESFVGKRVEVVGCVGQSKVPSVEGLVLQDHFEELRGKVVRLRGVVQKQVITQVDEEANRQPGKSIQMFAAGVHYWLTNIEMVSVE